MNKNIYLSGKISGIEKYAPEIFEHYEKELSSRGSDYTIINPVKTKPLFGIKKWLFYMITDIYNLLRCGTIAIIPNWMESNGAKIELIAALLLNKKVITLN